MKKCMCCTTENDQKAVTCVACGEGSWPVSGYADPAAVDAVVDKLSKAPYVAPTTRAPRRGGAQGGAPPAR